MTHTGKYCEGLHTKGMDLDKVFKFVIKLKPRDTWDGNEDLDAEKLYRSLLQSSLHRNKHLCISKQGARKFLKI